MKPILLLTMLLCLSVGWLGLQASSGMSSGQTSKPRLTQDAILQSSRDADPRSLIELLNEAKAARADRAVILLIVDLLEQRRDLYPDLNWQMIGTDVMRLELGDVLIQAKQNGETDWKDVTSIESLARDGIRRADRQLVLASIQVLARLESKENIDLIEQVALQQEDQTFSLAVVSLANMCAIEASHALNRIEKAVKDRKLSSFLIDVRTRATAFHSSSGWCK